MPDTSEQRKAGRPSKPLINRTQIGLAALELVDETGDISLPVLASRLGVHTSSLYHHAAGRAGVIELLRETMTGGLDFDELFDGPWDVSLRRMFEAYRESFRRHPRAAPLLFTNPVKSAGILGGYEFGVSRLAEAGVTPDQALSFLSACEAYVVGSALVAAGPEQMWDLEDPSHFPLLSAALKANPNTQSRADETFEFGLNSLFDSIRASLPKA